MSISEQQRLDLYNGLREVLGPDRATTLMTYLPSSEFQDLLTKADLEAVVEPRFDQVERRLDHVERRLDRLEQKVDRILLGLVGGLFVMLAAFFGTALLL